MKIFILILLFVTGLFAQRTISIDGGVCVRGESCTLTLRLNAQDAVGFAANVTYDDRVLSNPVVTLGPDVPANTQIIYNPNTSGIVRILIDSSNEFTTANADVAEMTFDVGETRYGRTTSLDFQCPWSIYGCDISDVNAIDLPFEVIGARVYVN